MRVKRGRVVAPKPRVDPDVRYCLEILEGVAAREAVSLLFGSGIGVGLADHGVWPLEEAVNRIVGKDFNAAILRVDNKHGLSVKASDELGAIYYKQLEASIEAAYLLGVAVGRRLGSGPLLPVGGGL